MEGVVLGLVVSAGGRPLDDYLSIDFCAVASRKFNKNCCRYDVLPRGADLFPNCIIELSLPSSLGYHA